MLPARERKVLKYVLIALPLPVLLLIAWDAAVKYQGECGMFLDKAPCEFREFLYDYLQFPGVPYLVLSLLAAFALIGAWAVIFGKWPPKRL